MNRARWQGYRFVAFLAAGAVDAAAQCSMCRTALAAQGGEVFNKAIAILLLPAVVLFSGTFLLVYRRHDAANGEKEKPKE